MSERVSSGNEGLDEVIGGGFPRGSLILLAGNPGTGKTVFSTQFLVKGAESDEPGVYISFAEDKSLLVKNISKHLRCDLKLLEDEGKIKILDFVAVKDTGVSAALDLILREVKNIKAKRLVIDSFTAMAQAFKELIDVRIVLHTVLNRIVRQMGCTSIIIEEVPFGESKISLGVEEFVADSVVLLSTGEVDGLSFRELDLVKIRGTRLPQRKLIYTLEGGFRAFPPFEPKAVMEPKRFHPIPDPPEKYSTGSSDLDEILGGGVSKGSLMLLTLDEKVTTLQYHLLIDPMATNFVLQGRGLIDIPSCGADPFMFRKYFYTYGGTEKDFNRYVRIIETRSMSESKPLPNLITLDGKDWREDLEKVFKTSNQLRMETGHPSLSIVGVDNIITTYGEEHCEEILNLTATGARRVDAAVVAIFRGGRKELSKIISSIADVHFHLTKENGCLLLNHI
ncbi:MAG: ATPase domain-containing protein, partial [Candidatus Bathyarchaeia archaeon]